MTVSATSYTRNATQSLTIACSYEAYPAATSVTWTKNSKTIDVFESGGKYAGSTLATPSLTINQLTSGDAGIYVCRATNSIGQGHSSDVTVIVNCEYFRHLSIQVLLPKTYLTHVCTNCELSIPIRFLFCFFVCLLFCSCFVSIFSKKKKKVTAPLVKYRSRQTDKVFGIRLYC